MRILVAEAYHLLVVTIVSIVAVGIAAYILTNSSQYSSLIIMVFMAGTIGGVANNYRRLYLVPTDATVDDAGARKLLTIQIYISPWIGGVFAVVVYGLFASGILQGELFPRFQADDNRFTTAQTVADQLVPATNLDAAKAILWAFIAGFAELFVPNFIDKLVSESRANDA